MEVMARKAALFAAMVLLLALLFTISLPAAAAMDDSQSPAPAPVPTNDGTTVDQGIAYVLMLLALIVTYIIH